MDEITEPSESLLPAPVQINPEDPVDVLSWLPYQLGFWPQESVVVIALRQETAGVSIGLVARFDVADLDAAEVRDEVERQLALENAVGALCVIVSDQPWLRIMHGRDGAGSVLRWWLSTRWGSRERTWLLSPHAFRCVRCADAPCCPAVGRSTTVLEHSEVSAAMVFRGRSYAASREAVVADVDRAADRRRAASAAATRHASRRQRIDPVRWRQLALRRWVELTDRVAPDGLDRVTIEPTLLGAVLAGMQDEWVRDGVLLWAATGRAVTDRERGRVLEAVFSGRIGPREDRLATGSAALTVLATHASKRWRVPVLATATWLAWWGGDGVRASLLLERTIALDADYPLARLLAAAVTAGVPPGWAREPRTA
ncbi:DUF4192 domain-containing protein [Ruania alba]|uniref:DUF4192 domain-containing protein n=1 Tax=Ruania alba TaxID=648782 RepID=A0A1H5FHV8_9MICO|nr:DUF4192 domain-containing protein [Ruania alba]SEE02987.1 protein of unknown function [Ruania alba]